MLTYSGKLPSILKNQQAVYSFICVGITSSLIFWPLLNSIFCGLLLLYWLISPGKKLTSNSWTIKKAALFAALYLPVLVGFFYSADTAEASFRLQQKSALFIFPLVFASLPIISSFLKKKIFWTLVFSTTIGCLLGIGNGLMHFFSTGSGDHLYGYALVILKDMHPSVYGLCCLLCIAFLFEEYRLNAAQMSTSGKIGIISLIGFLMLFLWMMGNRNNLICLNVLTVIYLLRIIKDFRRRLIAIGFLMSIWLSALILSPSFNQRWRELVTEASNPTFVQTRLEFPDSKTARLMIWNSVLEVIKTNWLFGVGTGDSQAALQSSFTQKKYEFARYNNCNAHNQYLQETIAFGVPGLIIFLLCLVVPFAYFVNSKEQSLYLIFLLLFAFVCLSESILQLSKGIIWYSFFNALFAFTAQEKF